MHELRLLGGTELCGTVSGNPAAVLAHPKRFALVAYLAAAQPFGWHRRDTLVGLLWPDLDQDHARAALRKTVYRLRQALGPDALAARGDESIAISPSVVWSDVRAFAVALDADRPAEALALYRGDFLPGLFVAEAPEFERWVERERDELRRRAARAASRASEIAERTGETVEAIEFARRAGQLAPDDEQVLRRLIVLLERAGDRAGALRAYEGLERRLATDLQVLPSIETQSLIAGVRAKTIPSARSDAVMSGEALGSADGTATDASGPPVAPVHASQRGRHAIWLGMLTIPLALLTLLVAQRHASLDPRLTDARVAVFPLENETGRPDLDFVGMEVQDWITRGLQETGLVRVFPIDGDDGAPNESNAAATARGIATTLGAATLIRGRYYLRGDSIVLQVAIVRARDGDVVAALPPAAGSVSDPTPAIDRVRQRTIGVLATHLDSAFNQWARATSQPPSFEAYQALSDGIKALNRDDYVGAVGHYIRAASLDSGYVLPLLMAAYVTGAALDDLPGEDSLLRVARRRSPRFAPFDEAYASVLEAGLKQDFEQAFEWAQQIRQYVAPGGEHDLAAAAAAVAINRPREAVELVKGVDLHRRPILDHWDNFVPIGNAYHLAGENETLLRVLRTDAVRWRREPLIVVDEIQALAGLSRGAEAAHVWRRLLPPRDDDAIAGAMWAAWNGARDLRAHGSASAARALAVEALDSLPNVPSQSVHFGNPLALERDLLNEAGRPRQAFAIARAIVAKHPQRLGAVVAAAVLAAQLGDSAPARQLEPRLADSMEASGRSDALLGRARLAAALGRPDSAVARLRELCQRGCLVFEDLHLISEFDDLRSYRPFQDLLRPRR